MRFPRGNNAGTASGSHQLSDAERQAGLTPFEELDDDVWTDHCPMRPVHRRVANEWPAEDWSWIVPDNWADGLNVYNDPFAEAKAETKTKTEAKANATARGIAKRRRQRQRQQVQSKHLAKNLLDPRKPESWAGLPTPVVEAQKPVWPQKPPARYWPGRPNAWAQACLYCGLVVLVSQGTFRTITGGWEASHLHCLPTSEQTC